MAANFGKPFENQTVSAWRLSPYLAENTVSLSVHARALTNSAQN